ncbi:MAG TPA: hypothetical protein VLV83_15520 [Acidobacteriota bacterium]|nr:hypothetical protein [Acidobacteriota bacterium]
MPTEHQETFRNRLESFVLFHLGVDAHLQFQARDDGSVKVALSHSRVHDFSFELKAHRLELLAGSSEDTEDFLLDQLTAHRRGGLAR